MKNKKIKLSKEEEQIMRDLEDGKYQLLPDKEAKRFQQIAERQLKTERMNLRVNKHDLDMIRKEADRLGIPTQSLVGSILHRYAERQLVDFSDLQFFKKRLTAQK